MWQAVREFNGAVDPYWSTPQGIAEWGGYATFDHHLGSGSFKDPNFAVRKFIKESEKVAKSLGKVDEYQEAMRLLADPTPRDIRFVFNQDLFKVSPVRGSNGLGIGVRNFKDPRLEAGFNDGKIVTGLDVVFKNGRIVRLSDGKVRRGWRWV
jgi:hypothetical protein